MKKDDPFGFDMSVSSAKKKNPRGRRGMSGASETSTRVCDRPGCEERGQYRAPKSPDILDDYFCVACFDSGAVNYELRAT